MLKLTPSFFFQATSIFQTLFSCISSHLCLCYNILVVQTLWFLKTGHWTCVFDFSFSRKYTVPGATGGLVILQQWKQFIIIIKSVFHFSVWSNFSWLLACKGTSGIYCGVAHCWGRYLCCLPALQGNSSSGAHAWCRVSASFHITIRLLEPCPVPVPCSIPLGQLEEDQTEGSEYFTFHKKVQMVKMETHLHLQRLQLQTHHLLDLEELTWEKTLCCCLGPASRWKRPAPCSKSTGN